MFWNISSGFRSGGCCVGAGVGKPRWRDERVLVAWKKVLIIGVRDLIVLVVVVVVVEVSDGWKLSSKLPKRLPTADRVDVGV